MDFSLIDFSLPTAWSVRVWNTVLGAAACLDFVAATVDSHWRMSWMTWETERFDPWLRQHAVTFGMLFSGLWFLDAFVTARTWRRRRLQEAEEARLLQSPGWEKLNRHVQVRAWMDFSKAILLQLILLPVGFYTHIWWGRYQDDWSHPTQAHTSHYHHHHQHYKHNRTSTHYDDDGADHIFISEHVQNVSVLMTVLNFFLAASIHRLQINVVAQGKRGLVRLVKRILRHPVRAARRIQRITQWLRWIKIAGPLLGTSNKLLGNTLNFLQRARQRAAAQKALQLRKRLWARMTPDELRHYAATLIQKTFRAARQRQAYRALQLLQGDRERLAAMKLQHVFRSRLVRVRTRIARKMAELERLQAKYRRRQGKDEKDKSSMTEQERQRMYKLKAELTQKAQSYLNEKLLLRPNTTFAVVWRGLFVTCVILELGVLVAKTLWHKGKGRHGHNELTVQSVLPKLWYDLPECQPHEPGFWQRILHRLGRPLPHHPVAWYCTERAMACQRVGVKLVEWGIRSTIFVVQSIYFLDVFVNFFTGRFHPQTGVLEPVPAFPRWIAPGMVLQLLLNPRMDVVAGGVYRAVTSIRALGPVRVFRWTVAFFFPVFLLVRGRVSRAWSLLVTSQNQGATQSGGSIFG